MIERLSSHQGALGVILTCLILLSLFFILQVIVPMILWIVRKVTKVSLSGQDIAMFYQNEDMYNSLTIIQKSFYPVSPYFDYKKSTHTLTLSQSALNDSDLESIFQVLLSFLFLDEKEHHIFKFSWQFKVIDILSIFPYLFGLGMLLFIYLPDAAVFDNIDGTKYYIAAEAFGILSFAIVLVIYIWWNFAFSALEEGLSEQLKKFNNPDLTKKTLKHFKICSYLPFSFRLII